MKVRKAAGAFIMTDDGRFIIIKKMGVNGNFWDIPKGGMEEGETPEQTILREMKEELGIMVTDIHDLYQDYTYEMPGPLVSKMGFTHQNVRLFSAKFGGPEKDISIDRNELVDFRIVDREEYIRLLRHDVTKDMFREFLKNLKSKGQ